MDRNGSALAQAMKTATFSSLRADPELCKAAEEVLQQCETLSVFVEVSVRADRVAHGVDELE
jgi:hypothetical protein